MKPEVQEILEKIDLSQVNAEMVLCGIQPWDMDSITERVFTAVDTWLLDDLRSKTILVEQEYDLVSKGILDLVKIFDKDGKVGIVDWKTTKNCKRPNYIEEVKSEFQSPLYLAHGGAWLKQKYGVTPDYLEYRALDEYQNVVSFRVFPTPTTQQDADYQVWSVAEAYETLTSRVDSGPWPRNRPRACFMGSKNGPTCPFYKDCTEMTMPLVELNPTGLYELRPRSKSSMKAFLTCPEYYRRTKVLGAVGAESSDAIKAGEAFHAGIESIYLQAISLKLQTGGKHR